MKKIEEMSYEEIINGSIPFKCNIFLDSDILGSLLPEGIDSNLLISKMTDHIDKCVATYLGKISFLVTGCLVISDDGSRNILRFCSEQIINNLFDYLNCEKEKIFIEQGLVYANIEISIERLRKKFIEKRKLLEKAKCVDDLKEVSMLLYEEYLENSSYSSVPEIFEKVKALDIAEFKKTTMWLKDFFKELNKPLDFNILYPIDKAKLMLFLAKQYLEFVKGFSRLPNGELFLMMPLRYIYDFLHNYDVADDLVIKNMCYDAGIVAGDRVFFVETIHKECYSFKDLSQEFEAFLEENSEVKLRLEATFNYKKEDFKNMSIEEIMEYTSFILDEVKDKWQVVDEKEISKEIDTLIDVSRTITGEEKSNLLLIIKKMSILLKNKPVRIIRGISTFEGYYGFIYSTGRIVLETLYEDEEKKKIVNGKASYFMSLDKFSEYANLKKRELMAKEDVDRLIHRGNWEDKFESLLLSPVSGSGLSEVELLDANIDNIVNVAELNKCLEQLERLEKILPKEEFAQEVVKIQQKKKQVVLQKFDEELFSNPILEFVTFQARKDFNDVQNVLLRGINSNNFVDFLYKYYEFLETDRELKSKRMGLKRNPSVAAYTKRRANCTCDLCGDEYIDVSIFDAHHLIPLSMGGVDNIYNTVCLCPNCHRIAHTSGFRDNEMYLLMKKIKDYLVKDNLEEYVEKFYQVFNYYLQMYVEEEYFMEWNCHKR